MTEIDVDDDSEWVTICSKGKCKNDLTTHRMYYFDEEDKEFLLIEEWDDDYYSGARCEKCIPDSYVECFDCSRLTQRSCSIKECDVKLCKDHRNTDVESHEWHHTGVSKFHGERLPESHE